MAWFGDGLSSLSNLKGQLTNFTKEVLSEGIVEELDRPRELEEANERCVQLQELLNSKDAEISLLRRQNCDLQKTVVELNSKSKEEKADTGQDEENEAFFWDPPSARSRNPKAQHHVRALQEQLAQATLKIRDLEAELKRVQKVVNSKDEMTESHQKAEFLRAKQDMMNRIIQLEEKTREAERSSKRAVDEASLINDFRGVISKLGSSEKLNLVRGALRALETENEKYNEVNRPEKSDSDEKMFSNGRPEQQRETIEKVLSLKEELEKKHRCLQNAYEQLYVECNQAQDKIAELEKKQQACYESKKGPETTSHHVQTVPLTKQDQDVQTDLEERIRSDAGDRQSDSEGNDKTDPMDEVMGKMKEILKNCCVDVEPGESIFEAVARQYVDAKWKKDVLERKLTELTRELKETAETKDSLQVECDDMQTHIDALLLEIQDLKLNLPSIPEASEERVASLESETESLQEELKRLRAENAAIQEETSKLRKVVAEISNAEAHAQERGSDDSRNLESSNSDLTNELKAQLQITLEENDRLREKIRLSEMGEKRLQEQLRASAEKCEALSENVESLEKLRLELEDSKHRLQCDLNASQEKEREFLEKDFDAEENGTVRRENGKAVSYARRKETESNKCIDTNENGILLDNENESFKEEERLSLLDRLEECNDKIELLNTEKTLLEQEYAEVKREAAAQEDELRKAREKLASVEEMYKILESEFSEVNAEAERLQIENENLQLTRKSEQLEDEADRERVAAEELSSARHECDQLRTEVEMLRYKETELLKLEGDFIKVTDENTSLKMELDELKKKCLQMEKAVAALKAEREESVANAEESSGTDHEKRRMMEVLEERVRENNALKKENNRLMTELVEMQKRIQQAIDANKESADMAKQTIESLSHLVREKDSEIRSLKAGGLDERASASEAAENSEAGKTEQELMKLVREKHNESLQYHAEIQRLMQLINEQTSQIQQLITEQNTKSSLLAQRETELLWLKNELQVAQQRLNNLGGGLERGETCGIVEHSKQTGEISMLNEKCAALEAALIQEQSNIRMIQNQLTESHAKEASAGRELERLRSHLVEMESSYTEEALIAEETRKELEAKLQQAEEKMKNSSTVYTSASIRANQQVETLHQQIALIIQQRDDIQSKLSAAEDKVLSQTASLTNLQIVLEQFQRDKERDIQAATERIQVKLNESYRKQEELSNEILNLKEQLSEAKECLQAASRLSEQLDRKSERIEQLTQEVERLTELVNTADRRIEKAEQSGEGKVDKSLIKNLLLGYLSSTAADKSSVVRVFATVLDFNQSEREKAGLNSTDTSSLFSRLTNGSAPVSKDQEASLSAAFIKFLESESRPKPQLPPLPIQTSPLPRPGHSRRSSSSSTQSTLLLTDVNLPTFPDFIPARNTGSILKEVLKDN